MSGAKKLDSTAVFVSCDYNLVVQIKNWSPEAKPKIILPSRTLRQKLIDFIDPKPSVKSLLLHRDTHVVIKDLQESIDETAIPSRLYSSVVNGIKAQEESIAEDTVSNPSSSEVMAKFITFQIEVLLASIFCQRCSRKGKPKFDNFDVRANTGLKETAIALITYWFGDDFLKNQMTACLEKKLEMSEVEAYLKNCALNRERIDDKHMGKTIAVIHEDGVLSLPLVPATAQKLVVHTSPAKWNNLKGFSPHHQHHQPPPSTDRISDFYASADTV